MSFRRYLLSTVSAFAVTGALSLAPAMAADMPAARMPVKAPPVAAPAPFNWTGFYAGIHGGGAWLDHNQTTTFEGGNPICGVPGSPDCSLDKSGAAFGVLAGFNLQSGRVVYGLEADVTWFSLKGSRDIDGPTLLVDPVTIHSKIDWMATVRGRLGITMSPTLIYVTGGVAFADVRSGWFDGTNRVLTINKTLTGWVAGGGIEHALAGNMLVRIEGLFHDLGRVNASAPMGGLTYATSFRHRVTTVRGALALRW